MTPGLKMWTWGYDSAAVDPFAQPAEESRPYFELWAGVTPEFFTRTTLAPDAKVVIEDTYSPTIGLTNVAQASRDYLANFYVDDGGAATLQLVSAEQEREVRAVISADAQIIYEMPIVIDPATATEISVEIPD